MRTSAARTMDAGGKLSADLASILTPDVNAHITRRSLGRQLRPALSAVSNVSEFEHRTEVTGHADLRILVASLPEQLGQLLLADMQLLTREFQLVSRASRMAASLALTRSDECRKFHVDWVELRLIVTYIGPGTEWVPNNAVNRQAMQESWDTLANANQAIVPTVSAIRRALAGDVLLLKGESFPGNSGRGAVHRSAPISASGKARLIFKLTTPANFCGRRQP